MSLEKTTQAARGRWRGILGALGIDPKFLDGKHHGCPFCGGKDRFRFDDKDGTGSYFCSGCGAGSGMDLVMNSRGWDFARAAREVDGLVGTIPHQEARAERTEEQKRESIRNLLRSARPVTPDTPACLYLESRCGHLTGLTEDLRAHASLRHAESGGSHPALLAIMRYPDGRGASVHRTYLTARGAKAPVDPVRKIMAGFPLEGSAVRLGPIQECLGIAEGIETAICAGKLFGFPVWAGISANGLLAWIPPEGVRRVVICGDNDANAVGQAAAWEKARRLIAAGFQVEVRIPPVVGQDWADVWAADQLHCEVA